MKYIIFLMITFSAIWGQSYTISIFGLPFVDVEQTIHDSGRIAYTTQTRGVWDLIWPTKNSYEATYHPETFSTITWQKTIRQGELKSKLNGKRDFLGFMSYGDEKKVELPNHSTNIFTLLAMAQHEPFETLDTKKFHVEHEGKIGTARFIWADSSNAWNGKDSVLCDHYRLDLDITEEKVKFDEPSDYFMDEIIADGVIRELYISRQKPKRVIQAILKTTWVPAIAKIDSENTYD